ncbi:MAG TPA: sigma-70 family RNA polymerase sigma factor [Urbifossiella sp.]|nr:sigma-70 family RNA polymerase sigma factor [Urbifossiella sp.]
MVTHPGAGGVRPLLTLIEVQALRGAADRDLLGRFAAANDEAAFRVIAERHGPMVYGVCARILGNRHDAEDALQATFLVFARRAATVRKSESLANWLHGVARRVANRLRRADRRRLAQERAAAPPVAVTPADDLGWTEVRAGLDEELARLPVAYREVLVLCYLEGLSRDEAGHRLGIDPGAVKGRLERGRRLLGDRLAKRGIGLSAGLAGLAVVPPAAAAVRLGRLAVDPAAASPRAAALTHEFLKGVAMSKLKLVTAGLVGAMVLVAGVGMGTAQTTPGGPPPTPAKKALKAAPEFGVEAGKDSDEAFIRRVSKDLRGTDPTPAEVHFFLASKDANKRATLVDLFVKERVDKGTAQAEAELKYPLSGAVGVDVRNFGTAQAEAEQKYTAEARVRAAEIRARAEAERALDRPGAYQGLNTDAEILARAKAARARAEALAQKAVAEARLREAAELVAREAERRNAKDREQPADPTAKPAPVPPPATTPARPPVPRPPVDLTAPSTPDRGGAAAAQAAPAASVEALRIKVQLAELTVRETALVLKNAEAARMAGSVSAQEVERLRIDLDRAQLLLREAQLALAGAEKPAARPAPTPDPRATPRASPSPTPRPAPIPDPGR